MYQKFHLRSILLKLEYVVKYLFCTVDTTVQFSGELLDLGQRCCNRTGRLQLNLMLKVVLAVCVPPDQRTNTTLPCKRGVHY